MRFLASKGTLHFEDCEKARLCLTATYSVCRVHSGAKRFTDSWDVLDNNGNNSSCCACPPVSKPVTPP